MNPKDRELMKDPSAYADELKRRMRLAREGGAPAATPKPGTRTAPGTFPTRERWLRGLQARPPVVINRPEMRPKVAAALAPMRGRIAESRERQRRGVSMHAEIVTAEGNDRSKAVLGVFCPMHNCRSKEPLGWVYDTPSGFVWLGTVISLGLDDGGAAVEPWVWEWALRNLDDDTIADDGKLLAFAEAVRQTIHPSAFRQNGEQAMYVTYEPLGDRSATCGDRLWVRCPKHPNPPLDVAEAAQPPNEPTEWRFAWQPARILCLDRDSLIAQAKNAAISHRGKYQWTRKESHQHA